MSSIFLHYDIQAILAYVYNEIYNGKFRHISLRHDYVRKIKDGINSFTYVKSSEKLADSFTKSLAWDLKINIKRDEFETPWLNNTPTMTTQPSTRKWLVLSSMGTNKSLISGEL